MRNDMFTDVYFKDQGPEGLISGSPLPKNDEGYVSNILFIRCNFHPNCADIRFANCCFYRCSTPMGMMGYDNSKNVVNCSVIS